ncbi:hypothetical protein IU433_28315 [Nocardia puris]|uniref:hypothetical protein n=1 Tax=Nocardia puris TaxID=208602 RepID=UPI0018956512|nr:hypothetical protein [Nocardia puris]MBF6216271.1 hypothetical protein [Nocardia puris]MBF6368936.1 hypothetical protein [Nocardia puris]MBF6462916.1 hypothetical protein [Nocardia puris]
MSPGKRAVLPPGGYRRPSNVSADGLVVDVVAEDGEHLGVIDFRDAAGPEELRRELVAGFARQCSSTGTWTRYYSCRKYGGLLKRFLAFAAELDAPPQRVAEITPAAWSQWLISGRGWGHGGQLVVRQILNAAAELPADTRQAMSTRTRKTARPKQVEAYTLAEFKVIRSLVRHTAHRIEQRITAGRELLTRYRGGEFPADSKDGQVGALLDQIARTGDVDRYADGQLHERVRRVCRRVSGGYQGVIQMLFPSGREIGALATLLICEEGWNLSVLETMEVPDFRPDGGIGDVEIHRVSTVKHRRPAGRKHASNNLVDLGQGSPGHALRQVIAITNPTRESLETLGQPTRRLLVGHRINRSGSDRSPWLIGAPKHAIGIWAETLCLESPHGGPLKVNGIRLRRTHQALFGGPRQNTQRIHEDVYLLRNAVVREESTEIVATGLQNAVDHAQATVKMRLLRSSPDPGTAELAALAQQAGMPLDRARELVAGNLDTATGACRDFEHSPFTPDGPCAASFLQCFACDNAVATSQHLPRITYLHEALSNLRSAVSPAAWAADWAAHYSRVSDMLLRHTTLAERTELRSRATDRDRVLIDQLLSRRLDA